MNCDYLDQFDSITLSTVRQPTAPSHSTSSLTRALPNHRGRTPLASSVHRPSSGSSTSRRASTPSLSSSAPAQPRSGARSSSSPFRRSRPRSATTTAARGRGCTAGARSCDEWRGSRASGRSSMWTGTRGQCRMTSACLTGRTVRLSCSRPRLSIPHTHPRTLHRSPYRRSRPHRRRDHRSPRLLREVGRRNAE